MKTAMLSWTKLNPTVKLVNTKKKFFNEFLYKIVIDAPGCKSVILADDAAANLEQRINHLKRTLNQYSIYAYETLKKLKSSNPVQIQCYIDAKKTLGDVIKVRVEEPRLTIYSNDCNELYNIAKKYPTTILEVHGPKNTNAVTALDAGNIISGISKEFSYKLMIKETWHMEPEIRNRIKNYLYNLESEIKITKGFNRFLNSPRAYYIKGYVYAKSDGVATFLNLICPGFVYKIYHLTDQGL